MKKKIMIVGICFLGMILLHISFPLLLGVLVNVLSVAVPLLFYHFVIREGWRIRLDRKNEKAEGVPEGGENESDVETEEEIQVPPDDMVTAWYLDSGKARIRKIISEQKQRGYSECWIRTDGICNVRTEKGYRRAGCLPNYPGALVQYVEQLLRSDGWEAEQQGKYLHIMWNV